MVNTQITEVIVVDDTDSGPGKSAPAIGMYVKGHRMTSDPDVIEVHPLPKVPTPSRSLDSLNRPETAERPDKES